jgi:hypothetical protein
VADCRNAPGGLRCDITGSALSVGADCRNVVRAEAIEVKPNQICRHRMSRGVWQ